jgi:DNA-binding transcriptional LysR family regulator
LVEGQPSIAITTEVKSVADIVAGVVDGSIDVGLVRCPPIADTLETRIVRREPQGLLLRRDHRLAANSSIAVTDLAAETLALHPRDANPGHYDAVLDLCRDHGVEPGVLVRKLSFDLNYSHILGGEAVAIVGESSRIGLPDELLWLPLSPPTSLEVSFVARRDNRSPAVERLLDEAAAISYSLGWI